MKRALSLARRARGRTAPNPPVGAVLVRGGRSVGAGLHTRTGSDHAEVRALDAAGRAARGATLYVTLEPCSHHGRTPPCVERVLASGVKRVVCGLRDPDPRTRGRSLRRLRSAGLQVETGVLEGDCRELVRGFAARIERKRPYTLLKLAASLDGRIATRSGESRWITGPAARDWVHQLRGRVDAIGVGSGTVLADDPELSARRRRRVVHRPRPIVVDTRLATPPEAKLLRGGHAILLCGPRPGGRRRQALEAQGARVLAGPLRDGRVELRAAWRQLARQGVNELLVEGGGTLAAGLLRAGLVDELHLFYAPLLIGGDGAPVLDELGVSRLSQAKRPAHWSTRWVGEDLLLIARW